MKKWGMMLLAFVLMAGFGSAALADTLASIKAKGVMVFGVRDSIHGFGYIDEKTRELIGYDVDFCNAIARKLGVKAEFKPLTGATRIPQLVSGNVDLVAATMTKTEERAKQIDFSYTYFLTGQKFITRKGNRQDAGRPRRQEDRHGQGHDLGAECQKGPADRNHPGL